MKRHVSVSVLLVFISFTICHGQGGVIKVAVQNTGNAEPSASDSRLIATPVSRVDFSGEWKMNDARSNLVRDFPLCLFGGGDRGRSKMMKIVTHTSFLTVDVASASPNGELVLRREELRFDDRAPATTFVGTPREISVARWSDDGQTMIVRSARSLQVDNDTLDFRITETWSISSDGKSILIEVNSSSDSGQQTMKLVYDRQMPVDYRF